MSIKEGGQIIKEVMHNFKYGCAFMDNNKQQTAAQLPSIVRISNKDMIGKANKHPSLLQIPDIWCI